MEYKHIVEVRNLKVCYRTDLGIVRAVDDVSFKIRKEEIFGLAGESGCGKSTLALAILRLVKPPGYIEGGEVLLNGKNILKLKGEELRQMRWTHISYVPQGSMYALNPVRKIGDQIADAITGHEDHVNKEEIKGRTAKLLDQATLSPKVAEMYPHELSGGMKQRASIAMAMALNPSIIIADEPTTALDVNVQKRVLQTLMKAKETVGASLMLITHDMAVHAEVVDILGIMYAGKIVEIGDAERLFSEPFHPYTEGLMFATPTIEQKRKIVFIPGRPPNLIDPPKGCRFFTRCSRAMEICSSKEPALIELEHNRLIACHLYGRR
jgi:peptide/nickel transport system ATP-binding protein